MSIHLNSTSDFNYNLPQNQISLDPIPVVDPTKGKDELQQSFLEALEAFENALNAAAANPDDKFKAADLKAAAEKLASAEANLKGGDEDDQAMANNFDTFSGMSGGLQALITTAEDSKSSITDIENAVSNLSSDPAVWKDALEALESFANTL